MRKEKIPRSSFMKSPDCYSEFISCPSNLGSLGVCPATLPKATADVPCSFLALFSFSLCFLNHKPLQPTQSHQSCVWLQSELSESQSGDFHSSSLEEENTPCKAALTGRFDEEGDVHSPASLSRRQHP